MIYTERQKQIIETSMKLIASGGIQTLTMKRISEGIDITEAAIYRHFKSKLDILLGILEYSRKSYEASGEEFSCLDEISLIILE
ncbi:MAG: helix-turn-helix transcriptional regulator [Elusimicrobia bacterium]|nr:helix-turn-helix transcriptional regulator [Elusimicrobiota bacterium]